MKKSRFTDEQIAHALRQAEAGTPVAEITRKLGVSEATFYAWKKKFGSLGTAEIRELRQLREENSKLKRLVADLSLDKTMLQDVISKKWVAPMPRRLVLPYLRKAYQISERRACQVAAVNRSTVQYKSVKTDVPAMRARITEIAAARVRYGYTHIHVLL